MRIFPFVILAFLLTGVPVSSAHAACDDPTANAGDIIYNSEDEVLQWCDGDEWKGFNKSGQAPVSDPCDPVNTPAFGQACADGTKYAGTSLDGGLPMYAARCDVGQTWNGSSCIGSRTVMNWHSPTHVSYAATTANNANSGKTNTDLIVTVDSDSTTPGFQIHQPAYACDTFSGFGHNDWYLPAESELENLYNYRVAIENFSAGVAVADTYWSSTEVSASQARRISFNGGGHADATKNNPRIARCVRKGYVRTCVNPVGQPGDIMYNYSSNVLQWCGGGVWHAAGKNGPALPSLIQGPASQYLLGRWELNEKTGTSIADSWGLSGGTWNGSGAVVPATGQVAGALTFDGVDDYINLGSTSVLKPASFPITMTAWIRLPSGGTGGVLRPIFRSDYQENVYSGFWMGVTAAGELFAEYGSGGVPGSATRRTKVGTTVLAGDTWYHVAAVIRGATNMTLYVNGRDDAGTYSGSGGAMAYGGGTSRIGTHDASNAAPPTYFLGEIDDVHVYNREIQPEDFPNLNYLCIAGANCGGSLSQKIVFSRVGTPAAGSVAAQDAVCQDRARAAGLKGIYSAWVAGADPQSAPYYRFWRSKVPYVNTAGAQVADDWADLVDGSNLDGAIATSESGNTTFLNYTMTNVSPDGLQTNADPNWHCNEWTNGTAGFSSRGGRDDSTSSWTTGLSLNCAGGSMTYCFEQDIGCVRPVGKLGDVIYNADYKSVQYCNGAKWVGVGRNEVSHYSAWLTNMGVSLTGSNKWLNAFTASNGLVYAVPQSATNVLIINPATRTATLSNMGATLTGSNKWCGGAMGANGLIYGMPCSATDILVIDPANGTAARDAMGADLTGANKWVGGFTGPDGKIYGIPYQAEDILIIDPNDTTGSPYGTATRSKMGAAISGAGIKWIGGALGANGIIYGIPAEATDILIIDPLAGTATLSNMGATLAGADKWDFGVTAGNGKIYGIPRDATDILIIDPSDTTATPYGTATRSAMGATLTGANKWFEGVLGADGKIYGTPGDATDILVIDPYDTTAGPHGTARRLSLGSADLSGTDKWHGGVLAPNGDIYGVPRNATNVLVFSPP